MAGVAGMYYVSTSTIDPYPTTYIGHTYPEKGHYLHHISIPYMTHNVHKKFHNEDEDVHQPKTDVRETLSNFHLEVELPGVKEHKGLRLRWTTDRTLLLSSKTHRPEIPESELVEEPTTAPEAETPASTESPVTTETNGHHVQNGGDSPALGAMAETETGGKEAAEAPASKPRSTKPQTPKKREPHLTVHERLIGEMVRAYSFPVDVDRDNTHAKLDAGLLVIVVPKIVHAAAEEVKQIHVPIHIPFSSGHQK